jgi:triacylglycerol lipase
LVDNILLVHGIYDTGRSFGKMTDYLSRSGGWATHTPDFQSNGGQVPIDKLADQIAVYEQRYLPQDRQFILLGFSMGGIVSRYYLQWLGGLERVKQFISISTPHQGTLTAYLNRKPAGRQLRRNSEFLADLNRDAKRLQQVNHASLWTPFDLMILPATSSKIDHGRNIIIPALAHYLMLFSKRCWTVVAQICREATLWERQVKAGSNRGGHGYC